MVEVVARGALLLSSGVVVDVDSDVGFPFVQSHLKVVILAQGCKTFF